MADRLKMFSRLHYLLQIIGLLLSFIVSFRLFQLVESGIPFQFHSPLSLFTLGILLVVWGSVLAMRQDHRPDLTWPFYDHFKEIVKSTILSLLLYGAVAFLFHLNQLSRFIAVVYAITTLIVFLFIAAIMKTAFSMMKNSERRLIILPDGQLPVDETFQEVASASFAASGALDNLRFTMSASQLGTVKALEAYLESHPVDCVMLHPELAPKEIEYCIRACQLRGIPAELLIGQLSLTAARHEVIEMPYGTAIRILPHRSAPFGRAFKRLTDIFLSSIALIVLAPVFLIIMALIKGTSPGPVFFVQERVGLRGRLFPLIKFRSMVVDAEKIKDSLQHLNEMSGPVFKIKNDPRVTPVGRFLRKTSLDELPQLWNVFLGHMSLVGPRPPLPSEVEQYEPWQRRRLSVRPGITCIWQISGRNNVDFDRWMKMDLTYIDQWSYLRDWYIILKTIPAVLFHDGAS